MEKLLAGAKTSCIALPENLVAPLSFLAGRKGLQSLAHRIRINGLEFGDFIDFFYY